MLLTGTLQALASPLGTHPVINVDFESNRIGPYTKEMHRKDWGTVRWTALHDRAFIVRDQDMERGKVLKVLYPEGAVGPKQGGSQFVISLPPSEELWLSYHIKFEENFDFAKGGKLPGLTSGGSRYTGGKRPLKGDGWSARFMWKPLGGAVVYLYYVDMWGKWGDNLPLRPFGFKPGKWHRIIQHIKLNSSDKANGVLNVWIDGRKRLSISDVRFRIGDKGLIDSLYFSTFHGGNSKDWAPWHDCHAFFDNFVVSRTPLVHR